MEIIYPDQLASYLRDDSLADNTSLIQIVDLTNELITEEWTTPVDPIPVKITLLALNVAARAWTFNPATANVESVSRRLDDAARTEKYRTASESGSVYLTEAEEAVLNGRRRHRSVRLVAYGESE